MTPCLQLVAPVGMDEDSQDTWFEAARKALADIPIGLLQRGVAAAMRKADHPSKIVPAIMAHIGDDWQWRIDRQAALDAPALPAPSGAPSDPPTPEEAASICRRYGVGRFSKHQDRADPHAPTQVDGRNPDRPCRAPSREDYIRLFGIDPIAPPPASEAA